VLVDTGRDERVAMVLALRGRINYGSDRADTSYLMRPDGAAAIVTEIAGLVARASAGKLEHGRRFAVEFAAAFERRTRGLW
jgi:hypothetical protein